MPRILLRAPYGSASDTIEEFPFEEVMDPHKQDDFLWGNSAPACAILACRHDHRSGRSALVSRIGGELEDLPVYIYKEAGQSEMMPCAEARLTERAAQAVLDRGIMPLASHKNRNIVTLPRLHLLADD
jgi:type VI secretion system protein ImpC